MVEAVEGFEIFIVSGSSATVPTIRLIKQKQHAHNDLSIGIPEDLGGVKFGHVSTAVVGQRKPQTLSREP